MSLKKKLKKTNFVLAGYYWIGAVKEFFTFQPLLFIKSLKWFWSDYFRYKKLAKQQNAEGIKILYPCLKDKTTNTPLDPVYFYQDTWAAKKIFELKPKHHFDVGSSAKTVGLISQFVPTTMIDIRPIELKLSGLDFREGSILNLPFESDSIDSISSICVIEHIGLGRYGDPLDPHGSDKAIEEIQRVVAPGGIILISVPVDDDKKIYFNGCHVYTRGYIINRFGKCRLLEDKYIYGQELLDEYYPERGFGTGLFMFEKLKK